MKWKFLELATYASFLLHTGRTIIKLKNKSRLEALFTLSLLLASVFFSLELVHTENTALSHKFFMQFFVVKSNFSPGQLKQNDNKYILV